MSAPGSLLHHVREHELKCWPPYFQAVLDRDKRFEVRHNDRGFQKGDKLTLREWNPAFSFGSGAYTGRQYDAIITYVLPGGDFGIAPTYCVLGLADWWVE